ncbi:nuclear transport factor 2 family protein [Aquibium sp. ELW1220]|uniref:nuclear transport factor 2 family protein n=1 Tax=Aquibium sp. ELW1220 TaxID=2976766 RepID=UPI0025AFAD1F|nr:nuclear transport factor 2 family protein [Aquibium sp. ELW1220]MDN2581131.1 nuclear transport factor 2 family protein [Aquibium sp. ELW1220]
MAAPDLMRSLRLQSRVDDPYLGAGPAARFEAESPLCPGASWSAIEAFAVTHADGRRFEEYHFVPADGRVAYLPVGIMYEPDGQGGSRATVYSDHHLVEDRGPILEPDAGLVPGQSPEDVLQPYFKALKENRLEDVLDLFEDDGYFRHSNAETFVGREGLRTDFTKMMGTAGIRVTYCRATDDGTTCALEVYMPSGRPAVAVYERGRPGRLKAVRIYM